MSTLLRLSPSEVAALRQLVLGNTTGSEWDLLQGTAMLVVRHLAIPAGTSIRLSQGIRSRLDNVAESRSNIAISHESTGAPQAAAALGSIDALLSRMTSDGRESFEFCAASELPERLATLFFEGTRAFRRGSPFPDSLGLPATVELTEEGASKGRVTVEADSFGIVWRSAVGEVRAASVDELALNLADFIRVGGC